MAYAPAMAPATVTRAAAPQMMDVAGLKEQAKKLNPVVGFFDPLNLAEGEFWGDSNAATIGFLRESEIKHGRIAMFGFVGYIVHANGIHWPTKGPWDNIPTDISPQEMWDLTPEVAKWQIILTISFLEFWRENAYILKADGEAHYMRGGERAPRTRVDSSPPYHMRGPPLPDPTLSPTLPPYPTPSLRVLPLPPAPHTQQHLYLRPHPRQAVLFSAYPYPQPYQASRATSRRSTSCRTRCRSTCSTPSRSPRTRRPSRRPRA
jgi:hypothetical protein